MVEEQAVKSVLEKEVNNLLIQLHSVQLQLHTASGTHEDSQNIKSKLVRAAHTTLLVSGLVNANFCVYYA